MKILQLGKFYPIRGGVEKVMYDLLLGLSEQGIRCDMLCAATEDQPAGQLEINRHASLFIVPTQVKVAATMLAPAMVTKLRSIAKNYDIIHIHHPDPMACLALFLSGFKGKVVMHWHSDILKQKTLLKVFSPLQSWLIKRADLIVGTTPVYVEESPFLAQVQHKIAYIPIGVEPIAAEPSAVAKLKAAYPQKKIVFSLGRLVDYKGYAYLIQAAQYLDPSYHLIIGGKGPLFESLTALIDELNLADRVTLLGFMDDADVPAYFEACDLFCLSSILKTEAFAIVQIEAMSCGKPIVSTHIPGSGVSWVNKHGESGEVVPLMDAAALAAAIGRICEDKAYYTQLAEGSKRRYQQHFTRLKMVDKCLQLYTNLLNNAGH